MLCFNLEQKQNRVAPKQIAHSEPVATQSQTQSPTKSATTVVNPAVLSNKDILDMNKSGLPAGILVAKIKSSQCNFDTSPASLQALKTAGVNDNVILAMVEAPVEATHPPDEPSTSKTPSPTGTAGHQKDAAANLQPEPTTGLGMSGQLCSQSR